MGIHEHGLERHDIQALVGTAFHMLDNNPELQGLLDRAEALINELNPETPGLQVVVMTVAVALIGAENAIPGHEQECEALQIAMLRDIYRAVNSKRRATMH